MTTTMRVAVAGETHCGGRSNNEDAIIIEPELGLCAVLDGMGGADAGEVAAQLASETLIEFVRTRSSSERYTRRELLEFGIDEAAAVVYRAGQEQPGCSGMGTTIVTALIAEPTSIVIGHVGDSRAYLLRDGHLRPLTRDHTIVQELIDAGTLPPKASHWKFISHVLTRNLGHKHGVQAEMLEMSLQAGDRLLLCSDGLTGCVSIEEIQRVLGSDHEPQNTVRMLIACALNSGKATDNISAVVLDAQLVELRDHLGGNDGSLV
jgi:protein phosphatase